MDRLTAGLCSIVLLGTMVPNALSQEPAPQPPPQDQQQPMPGGFGGRGEFRGPGGRGGGGGFGGGRGGGMPGGVGLPGGAGPEMQKFELLRSYIDVVDRFTKLAQDPNSAGVAAVVAATDLLRQRGPDAAINYLSKTLPDVKSPAIQRAIRIQLIDLYKQAGQSEKALEQLDALMKSAQ